MELRYSSVIYCQSHRERERERGRYRNTFQTPRRTRAVDANVTFSRERFRLFRRRMRKKNESQGLAKRGKGQTSFLRGLLSPSGIHLARVIAIAATRRSTFYRDIVYPRAPGGFAGAITLSKYAAHS